MSSRRVCVHRSAVLVRRDAGDAKRVRRRRSDRRLPAPRNVLRMKEALLSLLAGDIFESTPVRRSLGLFKGMYYVSALLNAPSTWRAWRGRQRNLRVTDGP